MSFTPTNPWRTWVNPALPSSGQRDLFTENDPGGQFRNLLAEIGISTSTQNPWVDYTRKNFAPAMGLIRTFGGGGAEGMTDWMRSALKSLSGGSWADIAKAGLPTNRGQMGSMLSALFNGGEGTPLSYAQGPVAAIAQLDDQDQLRTFASYLNSLGSMGGMNSFQRQAALSELKNMYQDYQDAYAAGIGEENFKSFLDYVGLSDFMQRYVDPSFRYDRSRGPFGASRRPVAGGLPAATPNPMINAPVTPAAAPVRRNEGTLPAY